MSTDKSYVHNMLALGSLLCDWENEGRIYIGKNSAFEYLERHIGRAWEKPENLQALIGPHGWAVFKALEVKHAEKSSDGL